MLNNVRYIITALFISIALIACSKEATDVTVETDMSSQQIIEIIGEPTITQAYTLGDLTVTHSEWADKSGTLSVQFQNNQAHFSLFTAPSEK
ncbi:MAG: hypothetical protein COB23_00215 [Methylophaga sp.]|nr:MAG: hypothetical protein COB23_00215 [Methylophaga sp.]